MVKTSFNFPLAAKTNDTTKKPKKSPSIVDTTKKSTKPPPYSTVPFPYHAFPIYAPLPTALITPTSLAMARKKNAQPNQVVDATSENTPELPPTVNDSAQIESDLQVATVQPPSTSTSPKPKSTTVSSTCDDPEKEGEELQPLISLPPPPSQPKTRSKRIADPVGTSAPISKRVKTVGNPKGGKKGSSSPTPVPFDDDSSFYLLPDENIPEVKKWDLFEVKQQLTNCNLPDEVNIACKKMLDPQAINYHRIISKSVCSGKAFEEFWEMIDAQKWGDLLEIKDPVLVCEVLQFYATAKVKQDGSYLEAKVNGKLFTLTDIEVGQILGIPTMGYFDLPSDQWPNLGEVSALEVAQSVSPSLTDATTVYQTTIAPILRVLYNIMRLTLRPSSDRAAISIPQTYMLYHLIKKLPLNFPRIMFKRIGSFSFEIRNKNYEYGYRLPYGSWLSRIFRAKGVAVRSSVGSSGMFSEMTDGQLAKMKLQVVGDKLVATEGSTKNTNLSKEISRLASEVAKLAAAFDMVSGKIDALDKKLCDKEPLMDKMVQDLDEVKVLVTRALQEGIKGKNLVVEKVVNPFGNDGLRPTRGGDEETDSDEED